jgi:hypothetical protein
VARTIKHRDAAALVADRINAINGYVHRRTDGWNYLRYRQDIVFGNALRFLPICSGNRQVRVGERGHPSSEE